MAICYILKSEKLNKFYVGFTETSLEERLNKHNSGFYDQSYSTITNDWVIFIEIVCEKTSTALKIEKHIKRMKSKKYIENLKKYPQIIQNLLEKYSI